MRSAPSKSLGGGQENLFLYADMAEKPSSKLRGLALILSRSVYDIDRSTAANDPRPSVSFSARKNPHRIPANTPPIFLCLQPRIWPHLLRLVTKAMSDRLLVSPLTQLDVNARRRSDRHRLLSHVLAWWSPQARSSIPFTRGLDLSLHGLPRSLNLPFLPLPNL
jgi:hypothetical protein